MMQAGEPVWVDRMRRRGKMNRFRILPRMAGATLLFALCGNMLAGAARAATPALPQSAAVTRPQVNAAAASWPLRFVENVARCFPTAKPGTSFSLVMACWERCAAGRNSLTFPSRKSALACMWEAAWM